MPNGYDRNWVRLRAAIEGFRARYGKWPTHARLDPGYVVNLREHVFSEAAWSEIEAALEIIEVDDGLEVTGEEGERYSYRDEGFPEGAPDRRAEEWLGVAPDRH